MDKKHSLLPEGAIEEFKQIYQEEYGKDISDAEALELGINLLNAYDAVYRLVKKEWLDEIMREFQGKWTTELPKLTQEQ